MTPFDLAVRDMLALLAEVLAGAARADGQPQARISLARVYAAGLARAGRGGAR